MESHNIAFKKLIFLALQFIVFLMLTYFGVILKLYQLFWKYSHVVSRYILLYWKQLMFETELSKWMKNIISESCKGGMEWNEYVAWARRLIMPMQNLILFNLSRTCFLSRRIIRPWSYTYSCLNFENVNVFIDKHKRQLKRRMFTFTSE